MKKYFTSTSSSLSFSNQLIQHFKKTANSFRIGMGFLISVLAMMFISGGALGQTNNYFGTSGTITGNVWSTNVAGPYTSALVTTGGPILNFNNAGSATGGSITTTVTYQVVLIKILEVHKVFLLLQRLLSLKMVLEVLVLQVVLLAEGLH
jgi:hypothetical protein